MDKKIVCTIKSQNLNVYVDEKYRYLFKIPTRELYWI